MNTPTIVTPSSVFLLILFPFYRLCRCIPLYEHMVYDTNNPDLVAMIRVHPLAQYTPPAHVHSALSSFILVYSPLGQKLLAAAE